MLTKTQYKLLIQSYMDRYECSYTSALQIMSKEAILIYQEEHAILDLILHSFKCFINSIKCCFKIKVL